MKEIVIEKGKTYEMQYDCLHELRHHLVDMIIVGYEVIATRRLGKIQFAVTYRKNDDK